MTRRSWWWRTRTGVVLLAFLAIAGFFLVTEHQAHALGILPVLLLLACALLHVFGHRRHGAPGTHGEDEHRASGTRPS